jgi:hypothetical protein
MSENHEEGTIQGAIDRETQRIKIKFPITNGNDLMAQFTPCQALAMAAWLTNGARELLTPSLVDRACDAAEKAAWKETES